VSALEHRPDSASADWTGEHSLAPVPDEVTRVAPWSAIMLVHFSWTTGQAIDVPALIFAVLAARRRTAAPAAALSSVAASTDARDRQAGRV
jgi:hypothetical protein